MFYFQMFVYWLLGILVVVLILGIPKTLLSVAQRRRDRAAMIHTVWHAEKAERQSEWAFDADLHTLKQ